MSPGGLFGNYVLQPKTSGALLPRLTTGFGVTRTDSPSLIGGYVGYNTSLEITPFGGFVAGLEAGLSLLSLRRAISDYADEIGTDPLPARLAFLHFTTSAYGSVRARAGYAFRSVYVYGTGGVAIANLKAANSVTVPHGSNAVRAGWTAGAGFEVKLTDHVALGAEYRFSKFDSVPTFIAGAPLGPFVSARTSLTTHQTSLRVSWYPQAEGREIRGLDSNQLADWSFHGQSTYIAQAVPSFRNPYSGPNSLLPRQARQTWSNTLYLGRRLWDGAEVYVNPEFNQGFGLSGAAGLAGIANGEATKAGFRNPHLRLHRYFLRQTIGFGGEQEDVADGQNTITGKRDVDRLTVTAGKFAINDIFDDNVYSHDPRLHFFNLALWESAAYDFPANLAGYTQGIAFDLNRKDWAVRAGFFQVPKQPNSDSLDYRVPRVGGGIVELEARYTLNEQAGKMRVGVFRNRGRTGSNREAVALVAQNPALDPSDAIAATRRDRLKSGVYLNIEQAASETVGLFARFSRNDGRNEILSFTDAEFSAAGGVRVKGADWGRPEDVLGFGGVINGLSRSKAEFLRLGGTGLLIGDGTLRYRPEQIAETFYAAKLAENVTLTLDFQLVVHPGHNADRGPVPIFGSRLHWEF